MRAAHCTGPWGACRGMRERRGTRPNQAEPAAVSVPPGQHPAACTRTWRSLLPYLRAASRRSRGRAGRTRIRGRWCGAPRVSGRRRESLSPRRWRRCPRGAPPRRRCRGRSLPGLAQLAYAGLKRLACPGGADLQRGRRVLGDAPDVDASHAIIFAGLPAVLRFPARGWRHYLEVHLRGNGAMYALGPDGIDRASTLERRSCFAAIAAADSRLLTLMPVAGQSPEQCRAADGCSSL